MRSFKDPQVREVAAVFQPLKFGICGNTKRLQAWSLKAEIYNSALNDAQCK